MFRHYWLGLGFLDFESSEKSLMVKKSKDEKLEQRVVEVEVNALTEQVLENPQRLLQTIIDTIEGEVFVKDTHGKYLFVNKAFGKDFGVDPKDVIGKDDYFVFSPETAAKLRANDKRIMATKKAENIEETGVLIGRELTYLTNKVPLIDDEGSVLGICGVGFDITRQKEMEKELEASEKRYRYLVQNSYDIVYSVTPDGIVTFVGPQIERFGYEPEDLISKNYIEFVAPEQRQVVLNSFEKGSRAGTSLPTEFQWIGKNGKRHWVEAVGRTIYDDSGNPSLQIGVLRDIAERKRAEEALKEAQSDLERKIAERTAQLSETVDKLSNAEMRYRTVADSASDWVWWENPDGTFNFISPSSERVTGYNAEEFIDDPKLLGNIILPEDRDIWFNHHQEVIKEKKFREIQIRIRKKNGEICWIEHVCQQVVGEQGKFLGFRASNRDITERKQSEVALKESEKNLAKAQRLAKLGSWQWNILTNRLAWSDEIYRIFGLTPQHFGATYDTFLERVHPDDRNAVETAVNRAFEDPFAGYDIQHRIVKPDGSLGYVHGHAEVQFDEKGKPVRMVGTMQDISELKSLETESHRLRAELAHLDRVTTVGTMTAAIAHEINQPLTAILSNAQAVVRILRHEPPNLNEVAEALYDIIADDKRAAEVIRRLREMLKGQKTLFETFDLNAAIEEVVKLVHSETVIQNVSVSKDLKPGIPTLYGDYIQMQQVILNLLINALDAVKEQPEGTRKILLSSTRAEGNDGVIVTISDSGPGIDPDRIEDIFNPFYTMKPHGTGLGLPICRSIIEAHGGRLQAENRPDGGALFTIWLPLAKEVISDV